jgi:hypothetical protein
METKKEMADKIRAKVVELNALINEAKAFNIRVLITDNRSIPEDNTHEQIKVEAICEVVRL